LLLRTSPSLIRPKWGSSLQSKPKSSPPLSTPSLDAEQMEDWEQLRVHMQKQSEEREAVRQEFMEGPRQLEGAVLSCTRTEQQISAMTQQTQQILRALSARGYSSTDTDRGLHLLRKHGWKSGHPRDGPASLTLHTRAPGDRAGIGFDASHARGSSRGDKDNRVSRGQANVSFIPFTMVRNTWHNILSTRKNRLNMHHWL
jgi:hypothetical protein